MDQVKIVVREQPVHRGSRKNLPGNLESFLDKKLDAASKAAIQQCADDIGAHEIHYRKPFSGCGISPPPAAGARLEVFYEGDIVVGFWIIGSL